MTLLSQRKARLILKTVLFLMVLVIVSCSVFRVLMLKGRQGSHGIEVFYKYEPNTMDVIAYGSCHSFYTLNTAPLWNDYGMAVYNMADPGQPLGSMYYYFHESLKTQKPKVAMIELFPLVASGIDHAWIEGGNFYANTLGMKYTSDVFVKNIDYLLYLTGTTGDEKYMYRKYALLKFPIIHSRYNELKEADFRGYDPDQGRFISDWSVWKYDTPDISKMTGTSELSEEHLYWLDQIVKLAKKNDVQIVFWVAPYVTAKEDMMQFNAVKEYANRHNVHFINLNEKYDELEFDFSQDMQDDEHQGSHMNAYGAAKVTDYMGKYLSENFNLEDHRGDDRYSRYDRVYKNWVNEMEEHRKSIEENNNEGGI